MFVQAWMTTDLITLNKDSTIAEAKELLASHRIRRLPVIDELGNLVGILSSEDIKNALPSIIDAQYDDSERTLASHATVSSFMSVNPVTISPKDPIEDAAQIMLRQKIGGIPVADERKLIGIITESDIFRAFIGILSPSSDTTRIELAFEKSSKVLCTIMETVHTSGVSLHSLSLCDGPTAEKKLLTMRISGKNVDSLTDNLWELGVQLTKITPSP